MSYKVERQCSVKREALRATTPFAAARLFVRTAAFQPHTHAEPAAESTSNGTRNDGNGTAGTATEAG